MTMRQGTGGTQVPGWLGCCQPFEPGRYATTGELSVARGESQMITRQLSPPPSTANSPTARLSSVSVGCCSGGAAGISAAWTLGDGIGGGCRVCIDQVDQGVTAGGTQLVGGTGLWLAPNAVAPNAGREHFGGTGTWYMLPPELS